MKQQAQAVPSYSQKKTVQTEVLVAVCDEAQ